MAPPTTFVGAKVLIKVGDGASPEVFAHPCLINSTRSVEGAATTVDSVIPDCNDQSLPAWITRDKDSLSYTVSGEGVVHADDIESYVNWLKQTAPKNCQIEINNGGTGQTLSGSFHLTAFSVNAERENRATVSITLLSTGEVTNAANS